MLDTKLGSRFSSFKICGKKTPSSFFVFCCVSYKNDSILTSVGFPCIRTYLSTAKIKDSTLNNCFGTMFALSNLLASKALEGIPLPFETIQPFFHYLFHRFFSILFNLVCCRELYDSTFFSASSSPSPLKLVSADKNFFSKYWYYITRG